MEQTLDVYDLTCSMGEKTSKEHVHYRRSPLWEVPSTFMGCRAEANIFLLSPNNGAEVFKAICKGARNIAVVVPSRGFSGTVARFNCLVAKVPLNPLLGTRSGGKLTCAAQ